VRGQDQGGITADAAAEAADLRARQAGEHRLRRRLAGAGIVLALAVIFVPAWFDRDTLAPVAIAPPPPLPLIEEQGEDWRATPPLPFDPGAVVIAAEERLLAAQAPLNPVVAPQTTPSSPSKQGPAGTAGAATGSGTLPSTSPPAAATKSAAAPAAAEPASGAAPQWLIQVGSFTAKANADVLLARGQAEGFSGFVETAQLSAGNIFRVKLGPYPDKAAAQAALQQASVRLGVAGLVMPASR